MSFDFNIGDTVIFMPDFFVADPTIVLAFVVDRDKGYEAQNGEYKLAGSERINRYQWYLEYHLAPCRMLLTEKKLKCMTEEKEIHRYGS